jgi:hypothetical protein
MVLLDRRMAQYGPETQEARELLRRHTADRIAGIWPDEAGAKCRTIEQLEAS